MSNPLGGRGQDKLMAVCLFPSINYTPFKYTAPIPYPVWRMLGNSEKTATTVTFNESEVYILDQTYQPDCVGDFPGQGGGVKSETVSDEVRPTEGSDSIKVQGQLLVRKGDACTLNKANTFGKYTALGDVMSGLADAAHIVLGIASFVPGLNIITSLADAAIYAAEGNTAGTISALAGMIPGEKFVALGGKIISKLTTVAREENALKNIFTAAGTWIKGTTLGKKITPCLLNASSGLINVGLNIAPMFFGSPVHAYRGAKVLMGGDELDYQGEGYLPFYIQRLYNSQNPETGWFGQGWKVQGLEQYLELHPQQDTIYLSDNSGRKIPFSYLKPGQRSYQPYENITLYRPPLDDAQKDTLLTGQPILANATSGTRIGDNEPLQFILYQGDYDPSRPNNTTTLTDNSDTLQTELTDTLLTADPIYQHNDIAIHYQTVTQRSQTHAIVRVSKQTDKHGHSLQLHYSHHANSSLAHLPEYITDSNQHGYRLEFSLIDTHPRLTKLWQLHHIDQPQTLLVEYHYDSQGNLIQVHKRGQLVREFAYTDHLITWQRYLTGLEGNYTYDQTQNPATARVIDHTLNTGQHYRFIYDTDEQGNHYSTVIEQPDTPLEKQHHYISDDYYYLTQYTDPLGNTTKLTYDHLSRLIDVQDPKGGRSKLEYHGKQLGRITHKLGIDPHTGLPIYRQYLYHYDKDQLKAITDPLGNTDRLTYSGTGDVASYTDANGNTSHYDYDSDGNLIRHTLANGSSYTYHYDNDGKLISQTDCSGYTTTYQYDTLDRVTAVVDAMGYTTHYHYDNTKPHLQLIRQIDYPDGSFVKLEHDIAGRLIQHTDAKGQVTQYQYDIDNRPIQRIDALGNTLSYQYDPLRRLAVLTNENGEDWTFDYDKADNLIAETRFDDYQSHYQYDKLGDLIHQIDNPNLSRIDQRHTYLQRDLIGQLVAKHCIDYVEEEPDTRYTFMPFGQPVSSTAFHSDPVVTRRKHTSKYQYDISGQLIKTVSPDATSRLVCDPVGQIVSETLLRHHSHAKLGDETTSTLTQTLTHEYDEVGNRTKTILPDGKALNQLYYGSGHLYNQSLTDELGNVHEIRHSTTDKRHQELTRQQGELLSSFGYDPMGRLTKQYSSTDEHIVVERHYRYDKIGQLTHLSGQTRLTERVKGMVNQVNVSQFGRNHQYQYDKIGRLTQHKLTDFTSHAGVAENFAFDPASNRIPLPNAEKVENSSGLQGIDKKTHRPTKLISQGKQVGYFYDKHGRVKTKTITPIDKDGEPLKQSSQSIVGYLESLQLFYTPNNELEKSIKIYQQGFDVTTTTTHYYYDAFGRRIGKSSSVQKSSKLNQRGELVKFPSNLSSLNTTERPQRKNTLMLWDGNRQIQEYTDEQIFTTIYEQGSFEPVARVVQLASHIEQKRLADIAYETRRFVRIGESEETINQRIADNSKPLINIYHYHCNHLGTPQELTNQDGDVIWLSYDRAWGGSFETIYKQQFIDNWAISESELQPFKFQGQSLDIETGLHYNRFRYYDSDVGMFISRDPIELMGGNNVFQYAPNPVMWIDPWGLSCTQPRDSKGKFLSPKEGDLQPGKDFEKFIADKLSKNKKVELLGTQVSVRTGTGKKDIRYMDALIRRKRDGKLFHIEVKSNGASRNADQRMKDGIIDAGKGTFIDGKNTPNGFAGRSTQGITTIVSKPKG